MYSLLIGLAANSIYMCVAVGDELAAFAGDDQHLTRHLN